MKFNIHQSVDKTGYFLDSLIASKSLKLVNDIPTGSKEIEILSLLITFYLLDKKR